MSLLDVLRSGISSQAERLTYFRVPSSRVLPKLRNRPFRVGRSYLQVRLSEMFLRNDREFWKDRYPLMHSTVSVLYDGDRREIPYVAGPTQLGGRLAQQRLNKAITLNHRVAGPIPYEGDEVELAVALFAVSAVDWADSTLKLVSGIGGALTSLPLQVALPVIEQVKLGLEGLLGLGDVMLKLGLRDSFQSGQVRGGNTLTEGYLVAINITDERAIRKETWVVDGRLSYGQNPGDLVPFNEYDYFLLRIEQIDSREDYRQFSFHQIWRKLVERVYQLPEDEAENAFRGVQQAIAASPDLTMAQKVQLITSYGRELVELRSARQSRKRAVAAMNMRPDRLLKLPAESELAASLPALARPSQSPPSIS